MLDRSATRLLDDRILALLEFHGLTQERKQTIVSLGQEQGINFLCTILTKSIREKFQSKDSKTPNCKAVFEFAHTEASNRKHGYIGTEHLLLGIALLRNCTGNNLLVRLGINSETLYSSLEKGLHSGVNIFWDQGENFPFSSRAKKVIELAATQAHSLGDLMLGSEHILIGLLQEDRSDAAAYLKGVGVTLTRLHEELKAMRAENRE